MTEPERRLSEPECSYLAALFEQCGAVLIEREARAHGGWRRRISIDFWGMKAQNVAWLRERFPDMRMKKWGETPYPHFVTVKAAHLLVMAYPYLISRKAEAQLVFRFAKTIGQKGDALDSKADGVREKIELELMSIRAGG